MTKQERQESDELPAAPLPRLLAIMARLRDPDGGCPWDLKQDFRSLAKYTLEEAYEVADAIERGNFEDLKEELGDLLLQIVFQAQLAREDGRFDFDAVAQAIGEKLIRRHPHVFGDEYVEDAAAMTEKWEQDKARERAAKQANDVAPAPASALDNITAALPALSRTYKIVQRATRAGFDWERPEDVFPKLEEEIAEVRAEIPGGDKTKLTDEVGDVLFTAVCLAHKLGIDPETALRGANRKFETRFRAMESLLHEENLLPGPIKLEIWEKAWNKVKQQK